MQSRRGDLIYIALDSDAGYKRWSYLYCFRQWFRVEEVILYIYIYLGNDAG